MKRKKRGNGVVAESPAAYGVSKATFVDMPADLLEVGEKYMQDLKDKARLISQTLAKSHIKHAVIGGLAVAAHVSRVEPEAERNTKDLDVLLDPQDIQAAGEALKPLGFRLRKVLGVWAFVQPGGKFRNAIHVVQAGKKVREDYAHPAPNVPEQKNTLEANNVRYVSVEHLLVMKLTSFRLKDQVHVQDLLELGLITKRIEQALPPDLKERLKQVKEQTERERLY